MTTQLSVTEIDIQQGKAGSTRECPVSLALKRAGFTSPHVAWDYLEARDGNGRLCVGEPTYRMVRFLKRFDGHHPVAPIVFLVNLEPVVVMF